MADMEFAIPSGDVVVEEQTQEEHDEAQRRAAERDIQRHAEEEAKGKAYIERRGIVPLLNLLLTDVYVSQPDDPLDFISKWFLREASGHDGEEGAEQHQYHREQTDAEKQEEKEMLEKHRENQARKLEELGRDSAIEYSSRFMLPHLIDDLLIALIQEQAEDVAKFSMSWVRWNRKNFLREHRPPGYADILDHLEKEEHQ